MGQLGFVESTPLYVTNSVLFDPLQRFRDGSKNHPNRIHVADSVFMRRLSFPDNLDKV
jgi:hypothetical protein